MKHEILFIGNSITYHASGTVKLVDFLTHTFKPDQTAEAYAMAKERLRGMIKAVIVW
jgi:threonine dehydrogenase-like Zn-dependent dehydrogenase